ncbi:hypothetical protein N781_14435 [Pontibacillus halophilus JSM 076056 = DSM 19796]|uniref:Uncharacterized protein n=1 Tax=Pontibacillus halophilus JSM 076056 = DSM 19796 TaxID=1385510 RepID=A0A0A5GNL7_9BACI|nr:hypothetical protein [Pontibacillus halophilus]KGX92765.1 hypothetical protein N781_14435 [Pontibacillus halophilus JSM 076056 = DSM 19796]
MGKKKKRQNHNGSQAGKPFNDAMAAADNEMTKEELEKAIHPTNTAKR